MVKQRDPGLTVWVAFRTAEAGQEDSVGAAVRRVRTGIARLLGQLFGIDRLHEDRVARIGLGIEHVYHR